MRIVVLSDIHSNREALRAVLDDASGRGDVDQLWCLGDTVGYGPDPGECVELVKGFSSHISVAGNHDLAATGKIGIDDFNYEAAYAADWTGKQLSPEQASFLSDLPLVAESQKSTLVHGSLRAPVWEYLMTPDAARATFRLLQTPYCLVGHSHIPFMCREGGERGGFEPFPTDVKIALGEERLIINPGSVGQPRDGDPKPSYMIYDADEGTVERHRVTYNIAATQGKMQLAGLPQPLIDRLNFGR